MPLLIGSGVVSAIADIDLDGHNEIIITGSYWNGTSGNYGKVWTFDIDKDSVGIVDGPVQWGQFGHDAQHTGLYTVPILTGISHTSGNVPDKFNIYQNYPNPFNPETEIMFSVPANVKRETSNVRLIIYDLLGREVTTLVNENLKPGTYSYNWDAGRFSSAFTFIN